ncbi:MAG: enoyl-CoA hydratase/isomerase family protein [Acidimicrobiia bacterium]
MTAPPVLTQTDGRIGWITLNRPEAMNAVSIRLATGLEEALARLAGEVDVIVIRGAGGNFSVGGDLKELERLRAEGPEAMAELFESFGRALALIAELPVPVVAAVEGYALAGGFELMQAADIAIVAEEARIADQHSNFGQVPGGGSSQRLPRLVGRQRALAHILTGDRLSGAEAVAWGLAYRAVPAAELPEAARALAEQLAGKDRAALERTKRLIYDGLEQPLAEGLARERAEVLAHLGGDEAAAGIAAFTERRA